MLLTGWTGTHGTVLTGLRGGPRWDPDGPNTGGAARGGSFDPEPVLFDPEIPLLAISIVVFTQVRRGRCTKVFIT